MFYESIIQRTKLCYRIRWEKSILCKVKKIFVLCWKTSFDLVLYKKLFSFLVFLAIHLGLNAIYAIRFRKQKKFKSDRVCILNSSHVFKILAGAFFIIRSYVQTYFSYLFSISLIVSIMFVVMNLNLFDTWDVSRLK